MSMSYLSKYSPHSQQSTVETELATLAADGFARLLADSGHAPEQRHAASTRGGGGAVASVETVKVSEIFSVPETCLRCDPELARIAVGVKHAYLFQRWLVLLELKRTTGRQGFSHAEFAAALRQHGVKGCDAYNARLLRRGCHFYWQLHGDMIYPTSYLTICKRLIEHAAKHGLHDLYATNAPGSMRPMYIRVSGSAADFEAATLNAWYAAKNNPTISRHNIKKLFNRDERTIRKLEKRAGIRTVSNIAETVDPGSVPLSPDGSLRPDVRLSLNNHNQTVYSFTLANTYHSTIVRQHPKRGQGRRAGYSIRQLINTLELAGTSAAGDSNIPGKSNPTGRYYCETEKTAKRSRARGNGNMLFIADRPGQGGCVLWSVDSTKRDHSKF